MEARNIYPTKKKITDEELKPLNIICNDVLGKLDKSKVNFVILLLLRLFRVASTLSLGILRAILR